MNTLKTTVVIVSVLVSALVIGCAHTSHGHPLEPSSGAAPVAVRAAEVQVQIDAFTQSIVERDASALSEVVSSEVLARTAERGIDLPTFLEKQRMAIARTFSLADGERPVFEVAEVLSQGDAVRVTLRFRGEEIEKPFYFVREGGALKLNFGPPGFSKAVPEGALFGKEKYTVKNVNIYGNPSFALSCYQGNNVPAATVIVPAASTKKIRCEDDCGFWAGSKFWADPDNPRWCDWNWWGADAIINLLAPGGWRCNDYC
ncbi:MAG: hypothetical protein ACXW0U_06690 [Halobacteriota archaeon]